MDTNFYMRKGFTMIELLVVIAIIGLLATIILAVVSTVRDNASDSAIKADLYTIRNQAALDYVGNGNSFGVTAWTPLATSFTTGNGTPGASPVFQDSLVGEAINNALQNSKGTISYGSNGREWVVISSLKSGGYWCVDSTETTEKGTSAYYVPGIPIYKCP